MSEQLTLPLCQRWRERRDRYRPAGEAFDPRAHAVAVAERAPARAFVEQHHYSGTWPAARLTVGLYRRARLAGVAVFSVPSSQASVPARAGVGPDEGVELGRFVLLDEVESNAETWFLARAFALVRSQLRDVRAVVSYSDPHRRTAADGRVVLPGHVGTIYQAHNGRYVGRTKSRSLYLGPDGREIPPRALSKLRNDEQGAAYAYARLLAAGAPARRPLEDAHAYVARALAEGPFRRARHPGCHAYVWAIDPTARALLPAAYPFPKLGDQREAQAA